MDAVAIFLVARQRLLGAGDIAGLDGILQALKVLAALLIECHEVRIARADPAIDMISPRQDRRMREAPRRAVPANLQIARGYERGWSLFEAYRFLNAAAAS